MVYIGVDLHRKKSQVAAIDQDGNLLFNRKVSTGPPAMQQVIDELRPRAIEVAFEATYGWGWFADQLAELGVPAHMAHPLATKAVSSARVKNDSVDAKTLAHLLRTNLLPEGWIAPPEVREARRLVRMRSALVRMRAKLKAQVHALLGEDMTAIEAELGRATRDGVSPATDSAKHLLQAGGKRVRPLTVLLSAACFASPGPVARNVAVVAELVHLATLLHDDVIDDGQERRGQPTSRRIWGNAVSVLAGDLLLTHALERTASSASARVGAMHMATASPTKRTLP